LTDTLVAALPDEGSPETSGYGNPPDGETPVDEHETGMPDGDTPETGSPDEELTYRERYEHLQRLMGRQANELGELRKRAEELEQQSAPAEAPPDELDAEYAALTETVQPWADEYYREYLDLGFGEEEAAERAWRKAYAEHTRVTELAERIADKKYDNLAPLVELAAGPHVLKEAVDTVFAAVPTDSVTPQEVLEEMIRQYPLSEFIKIPPEHQPMLVALARDLMIGRRYREGQLGPTRPRPAAVPNTGPGGVTPGASAVSPVHAQRIAQWRQVMGKAGEGISDEQILARIKEYEHEGRR